MIEIGTLDFKNKIIRIQTVQITISIKLKLKNATVVTYTIPSNKIFFKLLEP